jgi:hypothetical protein
MNYTPSVVGPQKSQGENMPLHQPIFQKTGRFFLPQMPLAGNTSANHRSLCGKIIKVKLFLSISIGFKPSLQSGH